MTTEISKFRRRRTKKRNRAIATIKEVDEWLADKETDLSTRQVELSCRLDALAEDIAIVKDFDADIFDLIEDDAEAEKDGKDAAAHNICIRKIDTFLKEKEKEAFRAERSLGFTFGAQSPRFNSRVFKLQVISRGDYINTKEYHGEIPLYNHQLKTRDKIDLFINCSEGR